MVHHTCWVECSLLKSRIHNTFHACIFVWLDPSCNSHDHDCSLNKYFDTTNKRKHWSLFLHLETNYNKPPFIMQRPFTHRIPIPHCILLVQPKLSIDYDRINETLVPFHPCSLSNLCDSVYHRGILNKYCYHYPTSVIASWWGPKAFLSDSV